MQKRILSNNYKLLMTGGHASATAYAVIEEIKTQKLNWKLFYIGSGSAIEGKKAQTLASINLKDSDISYYYLYSGRLQKKFSLWTIPSLFKV